MKEMALDVLWLALLLFGIYLVLAIMISSVEIIQKAGEKRKMRKYIVNLAKNTTNDKLLKK